MSSTTQLRIFMDERFFDLKGKQNWAHLSKIFPYCGALALEVFNNADIFHCVVALIPLLTTINYPLIWIVYTIHLVLISKTND
jgi:hypothetical protein